MNSKSGAECPVLSLGRGAVIRLETLVGYIDKALWAEDGEAFHSGRRAFEDPALRLYLLGINPGHAKSAPFSSPTLRANIERVRDEEADWSAHQAVWESSEAGSFQRGLRHLFVEVLQTDPYRIPASNLVFYRADRQKDIPGFRDLKMRCWPFHQAVICGLGIQVIVCLGRTVTRFVTAKLCEDVPYRPVETFTEQYPRRHWQSQIYEARPDQPLVVGLTHPSVAHWNQDAADPTHLVVNALDRKTGAGTGQS